MHVVAFGLFHVRFTEQEWEWCRRKSLQSADGEVRLASENQLIIDLSLVNIHETLSRGGRF